MWGGGCFPSVIPQDPLMHVLSTVACSHCMHLCLAGWLWDPGNRDPVLTSMRNAALWEDFCFLPSLPWLACGQGRQLYTGFLSRKAMNRECQQQLLFPLVFCQFVYGCIFMHLAKFMIILCWLLNALIRTFSFIAPIFYIYVFRYIS